MVSDHSVHKPNWTAPGYTSSKEKVVLCLKPIIILDNTFCWIQVKSSPDLPFAYGYTALFLLVYFPLDTL